MKDKKINQRLSRTNWMAVIAVLIFGSISAFFFREYMDNTPYVNQIHLGDFWYLVIGLCIGLFSIIMIFATERTTQLNKKFTYLLIIYLLTGIAAFYLSNILIWSLF